MEVKVGVCFLCLKTFDHVQKGGEDDQDDLSGGSCDPPLLLKFTRFLENYLQISSFSLLKSVEIGVTSHVFCEKCELAVVNPIYQVYLQLLSAQLRLSWELGQLEKLMKNSEDSSSSEEKLSYINIKILAGQLGIDNVAQLEEFRKTVAQKCDIKRKKAMPNVLLSSRCHEVKVTNQNESLRGEFDDDLNPIDIENTVIKVEPLDRIDIEHIIVKEEPVDPDFLSEAEDKKQDTNPNFQSDSNSNPKKKRSFKKGKWKCLKCNKAFPKESDLPVHFRYYHELIKCDLCGKPIFGKQKLRKHFNLHHRQVGNYPCPDCSRVFTTSTKMRMHKNKYHKDRIKCDSCNSSFFSRNCLVRHIAAIHKPERHLCPHCPGSVFKTKEYLQKHIRRIHRTSELSLSRAVCK